jgi:hypothetical protein
VALANLMDSLGTAAPRDTMTAGSAVRPCLAIAGSVMAFALLIERAGYLAAVVLTVLIASAGSRELNVRHALMLAVVVAAVMALLFVGLLDQPLDLITLF